MWTRVFQNVAANTPPRSASWVEGDATAGAPGSGLLFTLPDGAPAGIAGGTMEGPEVVFTAPFSLDTAPASLLCALALRAGSPSAVIVELQTQTAAGGPWTALNQTTLAAAGAATTALPAGSLGALRLRLALGGGVRLGAVALLNGQSAVTPPDGGGGGSGASAFPAATQAEAEAGAETALRSWSPFRVAQAIRALIAGPVTLPYYLLDGNDLTGTAADGGDLSGAVLDGNP